MGSNIADIRKQRGMTQAELAKKAGVSRTIISGLESGRVTQTTIGTLKKIANALDAEVSFFFQIPA